MGGLSFINQLLKPVAVEDEDRKLPGFEGASLFAVTDILGKIGGFLIILGLGMGAFLIYAGSLGGGGELGVWNYLFYVCGVGVLVSTFLFAIPNMILIRPGGILYKKLSNNIRIIVSAPVPFFFLWTLDFGFWIWDLYLGLDSGLTILTPALGVSPVDASILEE